jgi:regulatory protein
MTLDTHLNSQDEYHRIFDKAVKLLSLRLHTTQELRLKLFRYKFDKAVINEVLERLLETKVLNDEAFAENYLDNLIKYKSFGYYGIKSKLLQRGIESKLAERLLQEKLDIDLELTIAKKLLEKKLADKIKLAQSLARKGFRSEVIAKVVGNMV